MATLRIEQKAWLRGTQAFEIRDNDDFIRVTRNAQSTLNEYQVPLNILHPEPNRFKHLNVPGIVCMAIFGALCLLMVVLAFSEPAFLMMLVFFVPLVFAGFVQFRRASVDAKVFHTRTDGQAALVIWCDLPSKTAFEEFTNGLTEKLRKIDLPVSGPQTQSVADELRKLGELKKDGIISDKEFVEAKARLLGSLEKRQIGFK